MPPIFGFSEATAVAALGAFVFVQISQTVLKRNGKRMMYYLENRPKSSPPSYVFPIMWTILYVALTLGAFYFFQNTPANSWQFIVGFTMFMIHVIFNKLWSVAFWDARNPSGALGILVGVLIPTAVVYLVASIIGQTGLYYVNVIMVSIMLAWLLYAAWLNVGFLHRYEKKNKI